MASTDPAAFLNSLNLTSPAQNTPTSTILTSAITTSLKYLGYDAHLKQRVALLSAANTHTIESRGLQALLYHPSRTYGTQYALAKLFNDVKDKGMAINSNEPVLLINSLGGLDDEMLHEIADAAAAFLRHAHDIRPVRIYTGRFTVHAADAKDTGFSVSLLNVVNTDIGGPGMVQLLDMADWEEKGAVRKEHWDGSGWNLIERQDYEVAEAGYEEVKQEDKSEAGGSEAGEWESEPEVEDCYAGEDEEELTEKEADSELVMDSSELQKPVKEAAAATIMIPEEAEGISHFPTQDTSSQRPQLQDIKNLSWEREHDKESPLDMIAKPSQRLPISRAGNAYATAASKEKADLSGEEDYEVI